MPRNPHKPGSSRNRLIILLLLVLSTIGAFTLNWPTLVNFLAQESLQEEKNELREQITRLEEEIEQLTENPPLQPDTQPPVLPVDDNQLPSIDFHNKSCQELDDQIQNYFSELDQQDYMARYSAQGNSNDHFKSIIDSLLANPPIVARETDSLFTILTNTAHFYRTLGKDNILMIKDIILRSGESLEPTLSLFYQWSLSGAKCPNARTTIELPLQGLYEYSGFFLNTLGGQAYLFRRESRLRLLVKYYCLLILDRANAGILNRHGIDIVPHLESLTREMEVSETLVYKEQYLRTLRDLQDKYQAYYQTDEALQATPPDN